MMTVWESRYISQSFLTLSLYGGKLSESCLYLFDPTEGTPVFVEEEWFGGGEAAVFFLL
jgi:hypothetical protein